MLLVVVAVVFAGYTTYSSHQTNTKLADLSLMNIESLADDENEMGSGENDFPDEPFPDTQNTAQTKTTNNWYEYRYFYICENCYQKYRIAMTEVSCPGSGEVKCASGTNSAFH